MAWHYGAANGQRSLFCITFLDGTVRLSKLLRLLNPSCDLWTLYKIFMGTCKQALYGNIRRSRTHCLLYGKYFSFLKLFPFKPSTQTALPSQKNRKKPEISFEPFPAAEWESKWNMNKNFYFIFHELFSSDDMQLYLTNIFALGPTQIPLKLAWYGSSTNAHRLVIFPKFVLAHVIRETNWKSCEHKSMRRADRWASEW